MFIEAEMQEFVRCFQQIMGSISLLLLEVQTVQMQYIIVHSEGSKSLSALLIPPTLVQISHSCLFMP